MFDRILKRLQEKIRTQQYIMTIHAEEEMAADNLTISDIEHGIISGTIIERQRDRVMGEWNISLTAKP